MTAIAIITSSIIGAILGVAQVVLFGTSWAGGLLTYFSVAMTFSVLAIVAATLRQEREAHHGSSDSTLEQWQDWHEAENWRDAELETQGEVSERNSAGRRASTQVGG